MRVASAHCDAFANVISIINIHVVSGRRSLSSESILHHSSARFNIQHRCRELAMNEIKNNMFSLATDNHSVSCSHLHRIFATKLTMKTLSVLHSTRFACVLVTRSRCACPYENVLLASERHLCLDSSVKYSLGTWDDAFCCYRRNYLSKSREFRAFYSRTRAAAMRIHCFSADSQQHTTLYDDAMQTEAHNSSTLHVVPHPAFSPMPLFEWGSKSGGVMYAWTYCHRHRIHMYLTGAHTRAHTQFHPLSGQMFQLLRYCFDCSIPKSSPIIFSSLCFGKRFKYHTRCMYKSERIV